MEAVLWWLLILAVIAMISIGIWLALRRMAARFGPEGAIADALADANGRFALELPAGGPVDLFVEYFLTGSQRGSRVYYGMSLVLEVRREGAPPFELRHEHGIGDAVAGKRAPEAQSLALGPLFRMGLDRKRGLLLARVPAGGRLVVSGDAVVNASTTMGSVHLFVKPAR